MTSFAPVPTPDEIPAGMVHIGWLCTAPNHDCLMPLSRATSRSDPNVSATDEDWARDEVYLFDANHHAYWVPVFAYRAEGAQREGSTR